MEKKYNVGVDIGALVESLPPGLDRAVLRILSSFHVGRERAVGRFELVAAVKKHGFKVHERALRACISQLRKDGNPICATGGEGGGYYLAADWQELNEFLERELHAKAMDMLETEAELKRAGERLWGRFSPEVQGRLF